MMHEKKVISQSGKTYTLDDALEIKRGGEGRILELKESPGKVAKIYLDANNTPPQPKLTYLQQLDSRWFVKPIELLLEKNANHQPIGFIMELVPSDFFPLEACFSKPFCMRMGLDLKWKYEILIR